MVLMVLFIMLYLLFVCDQVYHVTYLGDRTTSFYNVEPGLRSSGVTVLPVLVVAMANTVLSGNRECF